MLPNWNEVAFTGPTPGVFAGLDGCRGGWILACWQPGPQKLDLHVLSTLSELTALPRLPACVVVDMPLALARVAVAGGRRCDREARALLPTGRKSSIFSAPTTAALEAWRLGGGYRQVLAAQRQTGAAAPGLSLQAFHLLRHIDDLQRFVANHATPTCLEGHPELAFGRSHAEPRASLASKHTDLGRKQRQRILTELGLHFAEAWSARPRANARAPRPALDDALDACILAHVSHQHHLKRAHRCPERADKSGDAGAIFY